MRVYPDEELRTLVVHLNRYAGWRTELMARATTKKAANKKAAVDPADGMETGAVRVNEAGLEAAGVGTVAGAAAALNLFHPITADWFKAVFEGPTAPQIEGWPAIARGESTLILAPTGTGKTLTAFLWCLNKLMLGEAQGPGCKVVYLSPLKALAADVERNLRSPLAGIANMAKQRGVAVRMPEIAVRTGDTSPKDRARFSAASGGYFDYDAGVALPDADFERGGAAENR